jgi:hypothetical protein
MNSSTAVGLHTYLFYVEVSTNELIPTSSCGIVSTWLMQRSPSARRHQLVLRQTYKHTNNELFCKRALTGGIACTPTIRARMCPTAVKSCAAAHVVIARILNIDGEYKKTKVTHTNQTNNSHLQSRCIQLIVQGYLLDSFINRDCATLSATQHTYIHNRLREEAKEKPTSMHVVGQPTTDINTASHAQDVLNTN